MIGVLIIVAISLSLETVKGAAYLEQWYYANDASCSSKSQYKIEGKALDTCVNRDGDSTSYIMTNCNSETVTYIDYDEYDCTGNEEVIVTSVGTCVSQNRNDHRRLYCQESSEPWAEEKYNSIITLNYNVGDETCNGSVLSYTLRYTDVCHSETYPSSSSSYSYTCDSESDTGTSLDFDGVDCKIFLQSTTDGLQTSCADFDFADDDGFANGNVGNSIFSCLITGTSKASGSSSDDDDLFTASTASVVVVILMICGCFAVSWFGYCVWCKRKGEKSLVDNKTTNSA